MLALQGLLDLAPPEYYPADVKTDSISFEELDRQKRLDRARDAERLRTGEITPQALQEENSIFPKEAVVTFDFIEYAKRAYLTK